MSRAAAQSKVVIAGGSGFIGSSLSAHLHAPAFMVRLGAPLLMRTDPELAIYGRYCVSKRLKDEGFEFQYPELESALRDLLTRR